MNQESNASQLKTTQVQHSEMVKVLVKPGSFIADSLTPTNADLWHAATGISGEAGELLDAIKKVAVYNKPIDRNNIVEELGDLEFYMEQLRQNQGITREETLQANMNKLAVRYQQFKYSDQAAQERKDKICPCCKGQKFQSTISGPETCETCKGTGKVQ